MVELRDPNSLRTYPIRRSTPFLFVEEASFGEVFANKKVNKNSLGSEGAAVET